MLPAHAKIYHEPHGVEIWNKRYNFKVVKVYLQEQRQVVGGPGGLPPVYLHENLLIVDNKRFSIGRGKYNNEQWCV